MCNGDCGAGHAPLAGGPPGARPMSAFDGAAFLAALPWTGGAVAAVAAGAFAVARAAGR